MDIIYILVPLSLLLIGIAVLIFFWAVKSGQFEDMESPAHRILFDDDEPVSRPRNDTQDDKPSDKP
ncbi:MAG: cbb3-type cytochrome oxidase assembly protein CcoS [Thalassobium sp.]|jgi:cbb3-type cytochrome oxidase maturation protein|uniref:Cbb3-type cytochrome oxidase assembly protein CcoS n=1 Tax=Thalassolituus pacificus TaxID=2975440 RepID=A0A9X2WFM0_9GAMM|nr:cbb3-type cytochrome oxidase assembly protein CcoS [Thalassolituus pacificus]MCT7359503.1 cbb3-type cytochrome oxidase assembly protein CcoS [Thalassolituus pacificus]PHS61983.1 MAG: cbb3-type cytochrome oxidase assembly protein CcoS [Thalassobium sp.]